MTKGHAPRGSSSPQPPGERQRKEERVDSTTTKTPARTTPRAGDIRRKRRHLLRAPVFSLPPCTAHSLFSQKRGPRKIVDFVGRGGRNGAGAVLAARRGRSRAEFLPTKWGVHWTSPQRAVDLPARQGVYSPPLRGKNLPAPARQPRVDAPPQRGYNR